MIKNSKQRAYLKGLAMNMTPIIQIGKSSVTPELTQAVAEALEARELIKISVLQNCLDDPRQMAECWLNVHVRTWFRSLAKKSFFIKKARITKRRLFFLKNNIRRRRCL